MISFLVFSSLLKGFYILICWDGVGPVIVEIFLWIHTVHISLSVLIPFSSTVIVIGWLFLLFIWLMLLFLLLLCWAYSLFVDVSHSIVKGASFLMAEDIISFVNGFKFLLMSIVGVGMKLFCKLVKLNFNLRFRCYLLNLQDLVVIFGKIDVLLIRKIIFYWDIKMSCW